MSFKLGTWTLSPYQRFHPPPIDALLVGTWYSGLSQQVARVLLSNNWPVARARRRQPRGLRRTLRDMRAKTTEAICGWYANSAQ